MKTIITLYNLSVQFETEDLKLRDHVKDFIEKYYTSVQSGFGFNAPPKIDVYVGYIAKYNMYYFHTRQFNHLRWYLETVVQYPLKDYEIVDNRELCNTTENYVVRPKYVVREEQKESLNFVTDGKTIKKLLPLATGSGKTVIAMLAMAKLGKRFSLLITPTFGGKWIADIVDKLFLKEDDIAVIRGSSGNTISIDKSIKLAKASDVSIARAYIVSLQTFRSFVTSFETNPDTCLDEKDCAPIDYFPLLKVSNLIIDETHMSFFSVFKCLLYINVEFLLGLSATLIPSTNFEKRVYELIYKGEEIYHDKMIKQYMKVYPVTYNTDREILKHLRWTNNRRKKNMGAYSHSAYEKSIMRDRKFINGYLKLINESINAFYITPYLPNDKCIIFVYTIKMADLVVDYLKKLYPNKIVKRYCEDDDYEEMLLGDFIVSTVGSAGTGLDIPNLRVGIQTVNISSEVTNIQTAGRLRELKDRDVKFIYLYCEQIPKHREYHRKRLDIFRPRSHSIQMVRSVLGFGL